MVGSEELLKDATPATRDEVRDFLTAHQGRFEIGAQPVQQYVARNGISVDDETLSQVKRLQRVYQITPDDEAMVGLMKEGMDAAYHVAGHDRDTFVQTYQQALGGAESAAQ